jgi:peptidyl-prolyl cis-trans isomerase A (cyclophilin A)
MLTIALVLLLLQLQAPAPAQPPAPSTPNPVVIVDTTAGAITIELFADRAPDSVNNFLEYVRDGFYAGTIFHRVVPGYVIQGGGYTPELVEKSTRPPVRSEATNGLTNLRGTIAVARGADPDSGTAQVFINLVDNRRLDYVSNQSGLTWGYTVFGKVVDGMDVVDRIAALPTRAQGPFVGDVPNPLVVIEGASVVGEDAPAGATSAAPAASATIKPSAKAKDKAAEPKQP